MAYYESEEDLSRLQDAGDDLWTCDDERVQDSQHLDELSMNHQPSRMLRLLKSKMATILVKTGFLVLSCLALILTLMWGNIVVMGMGVVLVKTALWWTMNK